MAIWYHNFGNGTTTGYFAVAKWQASHVYALNTIVRQLATPSVGNERCFKVTTAGTSGSSEPSWNLNPGNTTTDGTVTWTEVSGTSWLAPFARATMFTGWASGGDTIYTSTASQETQSTNLTIDISASTTAPTYWIFVNNQNTPPVAADIATAGSTVNLATTGASNITVVSNGGDTVVIGGYFAAGSSTSTANITGGGQDGTNQPTKLTFLNCKLQLNNSSTSSFIGTQTDQGYVSHGLLELINTPLIFGSSSQLFAINHSFIWKNTPSAVQGTIPTILFGQTQNQSPGNYFKIIGNDLSAVTGTLFHMQQGIGGGAGGSPGGGTPVLLEHCKLASGVLIANVNPISMSSTVDLINSDVTATSYRMERWWPQGTLTTDTVNVLSGGSSDGVTPVSWRVKTTTNVTPVFPFECFEIYQWISTTATSRTATINCITDTAVDATSLTNADIWIEAYVMDQTTSPISTLYTTQRATPITTATTLTSGPSAGTWTTTGMTTPDPRIMAVTFTNQIQGLVKFVVKVARPSLTTLRVDPYIRIV